VPPSDRVFAPPPTRELLYQVLHKITTDDQYKTLLLLRRCVYQLYSEPRPSKQLLPPVPPLLAEAVAYSFQALLEARTHPGWHTARVEVIGLDDLRKTDNKAFGLALTLAQQTFRGHFSMDPSCPLRRVYVEQDFQTKVRW
jgi:hypothetical protein